MTRHLITFAILLAALALYSKGFSSLSAVALIGGGALELWFWVRLVRRQPAEESAAVSHTR